MFKKMLVPALVLVAASTALPAAAQSHGHNNHNNGNHNSAAHNGGGWNQNAGYGGQSINQRQAQLDRRIDVGVRNGSLSWREANRLRGQFDQLARLEQSYRRNGLNSWERADLERRFDRLSASIRTERGDRDDRHGRGRG